MHHGGVELARGQGKSKKAAESEAALAALAKLREKKEGQSMKTLFATHRKILIGVVHLRPLPGSPRWRGDIECRD